MINNNTERRRYRRRMQQRIRAVVEDRRLSVALGPLPPDAPSPVGQPPETQALAS